MVSPQQEHFKKCAPLLLKQARKDLEYMYVERAILLSQHEQAVESNARLIKEVQRLRKKLCKISSVCDDDDGPGKKRKKVNENATRMIELDSSSYSPHSPAPESPCYFPS